MSDRHADPAGAPAAGAPAADAPTRPDTPCVAVCSTTFDEVCRGCGRTYIEVAHWVSMSAEEKERVWVRILAQGYPRRNT
ncbi:MAG: DUF1289 domain-containing protein [Janthinobacterium lividum]